jgi:hypothetical protein
MERSTYIGGSDVETLKKNWPLFVCTAALVMTPTWLSGQARAKCDTDEVIKYVSMVEAQVLALRRDVTAALKPGDTPR